jgi:hypothetical protein
VLCTRAHTQTHHTHIHTHTHAPVLKHVRLMPVAGAGDGEEGRHHAEGQGGDAELHLLAWMMAGKSCSKS